MPNSYEIEYTEGADADFAALRAFDRSKIAAAIEKHTITNRSTNQTPEEVLVKTMEVTDKSSVNELLGKGKKEDVVVTRKGR